MSKSEFFVDRLKGSENYYDWCFAMENYLEAKQLGDTIIPLKSDKKTPIETDEEKLRKAKAFLVMGVEPSHYVHIRECKTAMEIWNKFKVLYEDRGIVRRINLLINFLNVRLESSGSMQTYIDNITSNASKLNSIGWTISDEWLAAIYLVGLPLEYRPLLMSFEGRESK